MVDGDRAAPLEDCGRAPGYEELVIALADPGKPEHTDLVEWYEEVYGGSSGGFDPSQVDLEALDRPSAVESRDVVYDGPGVSVAS